MDATSKVKITFIPNPNYRAGTYKPTLIDEMKAKADMLLKYANGGSYTIQFQNGASDTILTGQGVKGHYGNGCYEVTENRLRKLQTIYNWQCDF
jgi:hypothetical protein